MKQDRPVVSGPGIVVPTIEDDERYGGQVVTMRQGGHVWRQEPQSFGWFYEHPLLGLTFEREIPADSRPWRPFAETIPTRPDGTQDPDILAGHEQFWSNSHYLVFTRVIEPSSEYDRDKIVDPDAPPMVHLSMRTVENDTRHDWREMMRVKNDLLGPEWEGAELYPAESRVVDTANQYHLWCVQFTFPFGFNARLSLDKGEAPVLGAKQRAFAEAPRV